MELVKNQIEGLFQNQNQNQNYFIDPRGGNCFSFQQQLLLKCTGVQNKEQM